MRRFLLLLAMLAAPAQARTVTATVYDPWYNGRPDYCGGTYRHWEVGPRRTHGRPALRHQGPRHPPTAAWWCQITDRCDCNSIDLSAGAAYRLRVPLDGVAKVRISY
jgi:hypothetical protein